MKYLRLGPVALRLSSQYVAWGLPILQIYGLSFFSRDSGGDLSLAGYHPRGCLTWHWNVSLRRWRMKYWVVRAAKEWRKGQWHDYYWLPFGYSLSIARQDYHKQPHFKAAA